MARDPLVRPLVVVSLASLLVTACPDPDADRRADRTDEKLVLERHAVSPKPVVQKIDWAAVRRHPRLAPPLKGLVPARIGKLPLPVLLPPREQWLTDAQLTSGPRWYAASLRFDRHSLYVSGNGVAMRVSGLEPRSVPGLRVYKGEGTVSATWQRFGATYLVNVECEDPESDPRCRDEQYVRRLVQDLVVVGGEP
jgi:hypothetical protein